MTSLLVPTRFQVIDNNGEPAVGAEVYTYEAGTTTPKPTYTTYDKTIQNTFPVILDDYGMAQIWIDGSYKIIVTKAGGDPLIPDDIISSADNVLSYNDDNFDGLTATIEDLNSTTTTAILTSVNYSSVQSDRGKVILANAASAPINVILQNCSFLGNKHQITIKKVDLSSNQVNIVTSSAQTIDGKYPFALYDYNDFVKLQSNGSNWEIISALSRGTFVTITATTSININSENKFYLCNSSSGAFNLNLAACATLGNGFAVSFKKIDSSSNGITILPNGSETIDGSAYLKINNVNDFYSIKTNGNSWFVTNHSAASSYHYTGFVLPYLGSSAPIGWVLANDGTIGDASSGSTTRANADTLDLFTLIWGSTSNADCPIYNSNGTAGTKGTSAANDFSAHKRLSLPRIAGRAIGGAGSGAGLTPRVHGSYVGTETHILSLGEMPAHNHTVDYPSINADGGNVAGNSSGSGYGVKKLVISNTGSSSAHTNMQPTTWLNYIIKL